MARAALAFPAIVAATGDPQPPQNCEVPTFWTPHDEQKIAVVDMILVPVEQSVEFGFSNLPSIPLWIQAVTPNFKKPKKPCGIVRKARTNRAPERRNEKRRKNRTTRKPARRKDQADKGAKAA